jgi:hypothetical protein
MTAITCNALIHSYTEKPRSLDQLTTDGIGTFQSLPAFPERMTSFERRHIRKPPFSKSIFLES